MSTLVTNLSEILADKNLFPLLQVGLVGFLFFAVLRNWLQARKAGRGGATLTVERGNASMRIFYATYAAISGLLVAICLSVEVVKYHRIFWVLLDTVLVAYVCLLNPWFRNTMLGWAQRLTKIEKR